MLHSGRIDIDALALSPLLQMAGASGNTTLLRVKHVVQPDASVRRVPFVSGNSLKHKLIRAPAALHALEVMEVPPASLPKGVVDLLFSGGHMSSGGGVVDTKRARELEGLFPVLGLCGYSSGNRMREGRVAVDDLDLVCAENAHLAPPALLSLPHARQLAGAFRHDEFGTRKEASGNPAVAGYLQPEALDLLAVKGKTREETGSSQMIFNFETIASGSRLFGAIHYRTLSELEMACLVAALERACEGVREDGRIEVRLGAKGNQGYGRLALLLQGWARQVQGPQMDALDLAIKSPTGRGADARAAYVQHLRDRRSDILDALTECAK